MYMMTLAWEELFYLKVSVLKVVSSIDFEIFFQASYFGKVLSVGENVKSS